MRTPQPDPSGNGTRGRAPGDETGSGHGTEPERDAGPEHTDDPLRDPQWDLVRAAAGTPVPTPPGLVARVLRSVHGVRGTLLAEPLEYQQEHGRLQIGERALVLLTRRLGKELGASIGDVHVSAVGLEPDGLDVLVTVRYGVAATDVAARLRTRLTQALHAVVGPEVPTVNVHIADVHTGR
jgi:hypothetical protein